MGQNSELDVENPFWAFSIKFYGESEVSSSCLALQDNVGADINILLYCCWIASQGALKIKAAEFVEIISVVQPWQSRVIGRLRDIRRSMKQDKELILGTLSMGLRTSIKDIELEAEKLEQMILYKSGQKIFLDERLPRSDRIINARINLSTYIEVISDNNSEVSNSLILTICERLQLFVK